MFLQTAVQAVTSQTQEHVFSFWKIMFHGNIFANVVMITVLALGVFALYIFLERLFYINRMLKINDSNLMNNIADLLKDGRIQSAIDYCEKQN